MLLCVNNTQIFFLHITTKGPPPRCLPQGPHHPRSTPALEYFKLYC